MTIDSPYFSKLLDSFSFVFKKFNFDYDMNKIDFKSYRYNTRLEYFVFPLDFMVPKTELFSFLEHVDIEPNIFLFTDKEFNFLSIEFNYRIVMSPIINGWSSFDTSSFFGLRISYDDILEIVDITYNFNSPDHATQVIKTHNMLCPLHEEAQLIELFFRDPEQLHTSFPALSIVGVYDYSSVNFEQSLEVIRMMNI